MPPNPNCTRASKIQEAIMNENNPVSVLERLIEICKDGQKGYQEAASKIKRSDLKTFFNEQSLERARFAGELEAELIRLGKSGQESLRFGCGNSASRLGRHESCVGRRRQDRSGMAGARRGHRQRRVSKGGDGGFARKHRADRPPPGR